MRNTKTMNRTKHFRIVGSILDSKTKKSEMEENKEGKQKKIRN
jgi:hypothetical protein